MVKSQAHQLLMYGYRTCRGKQLTANVTAVKLKPGPIVYLESFILSKFASNSINHQIQACATFG